MIIETENSSYEIKGKTICKIGGESHSILEEPRVFEEFAYPPKVGRVLFVAFPNGDVLRSSTVKAIVAGSYNEDD